MLLPNLRIGVVKGVRTVKALASYIIAITLTGSVFSGLCFAFGLMFVLLCLVCCYLYSVLHIPLILSWVISWYLAGVFVDWLVLSKIDVRIEKEPKGN